jgi:hypothetical protein
MFPRRNLAGVPKIYFRQNKSMHQRTESDSQNVEQSHPAKHQKFDHQLDPPNDCGDFMCDEEDIQQSIELEEHMSDEEDIRQPVELEEQSHKTLMIPTAFSVLRFSDCIIGH